MATIIFIYYYILPFVSLTGLILEMISLIVFIKIINSNSSSVKLTSIYKYLFAYSLSDSISLIILSFIGISKCGSHCDGLDTSQLAKKYQLYFYLFLNNLFGTFSELIEFKIAFDRYLTIFCKNFSSNSGSKRNKIVSR